MHILKSGSDLCLCIPERSDDCPPTLDLINSGRLNALYAIREG